MLLFLVAGSASGQEMLPTVNLAEAAIVYDNGDLPLVKHMARNLTANADDKNTNTAGGATSAKNPGANRNTIDASNLYAAAASESANANMVAAGTYLQPKNLFASAPITGEATIAVIAHDSDGPHIFAISPVLSAIFPPISAPFIAVNESAVNVIANTRNARYTPVAFARKNILLVTPCASAMDAVPDSISRRIPLTGKNIAYAAPNMNSAENPASRAIRVLSPN